jgi:hypothetical protein
VQYNKKARETERKRSGKMNFDEVIEKVRQKIGIERLTT